RVLPAGTDTGSMIALNRTLYERARDMGGYRMTSSAVAMSQDLETALRACLADCPDSEDEVRPKERADTGSWDVSRLKIDHGSPMEGYEAARLHHAVRWRGGCVAPRGARAAGEGADPRRAGYSQDQSGRILAGVSAGTTRSGVYRGAEHSI